MLKSLSVLKFAAKVTGVSVALASPIIVGATGLGLALSHENQTEIVVQDYLQTDEGQEFEKQRGVYLDELQQQYINQEIEKEYYVSKKNELNSESYVHKQINTNEQWDSILKQAVDEDGKYAAYGFLLGLSGFGILSFVNLGVFGYLSNQSVEVPDIYRDAYDTMKWEFEEADKKKGKGGEPKDKGDGHHKNIEIIKVRGLRPVREKYEK